MQLKSKFLILILLFSLPTCVSAIDIFNYISLPDKPLGIDPVPSWVNENSKLDLKYEINEEYKKWLGNQKVTSFDGYSYNGELQVNPVKHFAFGFTKKFLAHQSWINNEDKDLPLFNLGSNNRVSGAYIKLGSDRLKFMFGRTNTEDLLDGYYDLHEDIIAALGSEPDITFNTKGTCDYARVYAEYNKFRFQFGCESNRYKHRIEGATDIMSLAINHNRKVKNKEAELSYNIGKRWFPYIRYSDYKDSGYGRDYRDNRVLIGENNTNFKFNTKTLGAAYEYKHGWYYADYSRFFADLSGDVFFNMVNIDVLFFFATRYVDYKVSYKPERGHMGRIGFKRHHRKIEYGAQYSLGKLHGNTCKISKKTKMGGSELETEIINRSLYLHRMDIYASRPDKYGSWNLGLKLLVPQFKKDSEKGGEVSSDNKPHKSYRGGWQLTVMREFKL